MTDSGGSMASERCAGSVSGGGEKREAVMITKHDFSCVTKAIRKEQAKKAAPCLVAEIKMIAASSSYSQVRQGTISSWNDNQNKMRCGFFEMLSGTGKIRWNFCQYIDEPAFTRRIENALVKGAVLKIGDYAALLDGTWHGLSKDQASVVGGQSDWPILQKQSYDEIREGLLSLAATELTASPGTV